MKKSIIVVLFALTVGASVAQQGAAEATNVLSGGSAPEILTAHFSNGILQFAFKESADLPVTVDLYSPLGVKIKTVYQGAVAGGIIISAEIGHLDKGIYFLQVLSGNNSHVRRFSVTK
ncbi:MAG: hypothetical protein KatS3mg031_2734 [Chitinophagales bacterium]|nr:MAG: hypothetical protein KatS3mg031_2734 [Chitinophagales bacterium]